MSDQDEGSNGLNIGTITITYEMDSSGDMITGVHVDGDLPMVTQLGLLALAKDTILSGTYSDEHEDDE